MKAYTKILAAAAVLVGVWGVGAAPTSAEETSTSILRVDFGFNWTDGNCVGLATPHLCYQTAINYEFLINGNRFTRTSITNTYGHDDLFAFPDYTGTLYWWALPQQSLSVRGQIEVSGAGEYFINAGNVYGGDAHANNVVNVQDFNYIQNAYGCGCGDACYDPTGDLTDNCLVNIQDYSIYSRNQGRAGVVKW